MFVHTAGGYLRRQGERLASAAHDTNHHASTNGKWWLAAPENEQCSSRWYPRAATFIPLLLIVRAFFELPSICLLEPFGIQCASCKIDTAFPT